jgi:fumarate reductase (CoM/CoB) subunit B
MSTYSAVQTLRNNNDRCVHCGVCSHECDLLDTMLPISVGDIMLRFISLGQGLDIKADLSQETYLEAVSALAVDNPDLIRLIRRCCMCSNCTASCPHDVEGRAVFAALRELLVLSGVVTLQGSAADQVDEEGNAFLAYRAAFEVDYVDLPHLERAQEICADTLFFPGCTLVSYAPSLTREIYSWMCDQGYKVVLNEECCGMPLISAGLLDKSSAVRENMSKRIMESGIKRIVFACPACFDELHKNIHQLAGIELVPLPQVLEEKGKRPRVDEVSAMGVIALYDSCHDCKQDFGKSIRTLFHGFKRQSLLKEGNKTQCCGGHGAVALVDEELAIRRTQRVLIDGYTVSADTLVANCPTCSYTFAAHRRNHERYANGAIRSYNYLELIFENGFEWDTVLDNLQIMHSRKDTLLQED